jgi:hypothetical protein
MLAPDPYLAPADIFVSPLRQPRLPVHNAVNLHSHVSIIGGRLHLSILGAIIFFSDPTGQTAGSSDVDGDVVLDRLVD